MTKSPIIAFTLGVLAVLLAGELPAVAQTFPSKPIKMIVPSTAGGITDFVGRLAADYIASATGQPVIVENRPGAGGAVGMEAVAHAAPDGYTLGAINTGDIIGGFLHTSLSFDPFKDLLPIAMFAEAPQLLVVSAHVPAQTFQEFLAYARANPGKINYGSAGTGSLTQIGAEQLARLAGLQLVHVPYRGAIPAVTDMIAGRVQMMHISLNPTYRTYQGRHAAAARRDREGSLDRLPAGCADDCGSRPARLRDGHLVRARRTARHAEADRGSDQRLYALDGRRSGDEEAIDRWFHAAAVEKRGRIRGLSGAGCAALAADRP